MEFAIKQKQKVWNEFEFQNGRGENAKNVNALVINTTKIYTSLFF